MALITESELLEATGYEHRGRLARCLEKQGIRFYRGDRGRIWTTLDEVNRALHPEIGGSANEIEFE
jgi:hypothetical protein